jgi:hypothetical protein
MEDNWVYATERDILIAYIDFTEYPSKNNFWKVIKALELKIKAQNEQKEVNHVNER